MIKAIQSMGWLKTILTIIATVIGIATGSWALSANVSANVEETSRRVIRQELSDYGPAHDANRDAVIDTKINIHKLESEVELNEKLDEIKKQNTENRVLLNELIRRSK